MQNTKLALAMSALAMLASLFAQPALADCAPGTEVRNRLGFAGWLDRTITLQPGDATVLNGIAARHCGNIKHLDLGREANAFDTGLLNRTKIRAYGFTNTTTDKLVYSVNVPRGQAGRYRASLWFGRDEVTEGNVFRITGSGSADAVRIGARGPTALEVQNVINYARPATNGFIVLNEGRNEVEVRLERISSEQVAFGRAASTSRVRGIQIAALELIKDSDHAAYVEQAREVPGEMEWISEPGRWGLFFHHSSIFSRTYAAGNHVRGGRYPRGELIRDDWQRYVEDFDVVAFADKVEEMGASYAVMTIFHGLPYFPGPSDVLDRIMPGQTAQRDLVRDLGNELERRGMRLALYFHSGKDDDQFLDAMGYNDFRNIQRYNDNLIALHGELANRYNGTGGYPKLLSTALYFDAIWQGMVQRDFPWKKFIDTVKAPNALPDSIYGFSVQHMWPASPLGDIYITDSGGSAAVREQQLYDLPGSRKDGTTLGLLPGHPIRLEQTWFYGRTDGSWDSTRPIHDVDNLTALIAHGTGMGGPVFVNLIMSGDVRSNVPFFDPESVDRMRAVSASVAAARRTDLIDASNYDAITYSGDWGVDVVSSAHLSSVRSVAQNGASFNATFNGSSIALYMGRTGQNGRFSVSIDGRSFGNVTVSGNGGSVLAFEEDDLSNGRHTIEVRSLSGNRIALDYMRIGEGSAPGDDAGSGNDSNNSNGGIVDDADSSINYVGNGWLSFDRPENLDGTVSATNVVGDYAEYTFTGDTLEIWSQYGPGAGIVDVFIDGQLMTTVDTYRASHGIGQRIFNQSSLGAGPHTLRLVCTGRRNQSATNSWCHLDRLVTDTASTSTTTSTSGPRSIDNAVFSEITYTGNWQHYDTPRGENGTMSRTNSAGAAAEVTFNGTGFSLIARRGLDDGIINVFVDGELNRTVDLYRTSTERGSVVSINGLSSGQHTVRVVCTGNANSAARNNFCHLDELEIR